MKELVLLNIALIIIIVIGLVLLKKYCKSEKAKRIILLVASILTILCHYSSLVYHQIVDGTALDYLRSNPNLILPIYPCNVVMWSCLILGLLKNKSSKVGSFLVDFVFWFGLFSALIGMFFNVDFIRKPTLQDFDITKGVLSHSLLLLNSLLLPVLGFVKIKLEKNTLHIIYSIILLYLIGLYCNLVFEVLCSSEYAYNVNSMFILHSPFEGLEFLTFYVISILALLLYFILFVVLEFIYYPKGNRWYNRFKQVINKNKKG